MTIVRGNLKECHCNFAPTFIDISPLLEVKFNGHCLINKIPDSGKVINIYISHTLEL